MGNEESNYNEWQTLLKHFSEEIGITQNNNNNINNNYCFIFLKFQSILSPKSLLLIFNVAKEINKMAAVKIITLTGGEKEGMLQKSHWWLVATVLKRGKCLFNSFKVFV